ncbi:helix-turn-helix domain-containing protein [Nocardia sp. NPDC050406]|uniref:helix-turn-helix domain-containing protein n=1 Tax=Nocardia sp. NPDC050406 TaxID=3364318 RepID=UPI0037A2441D
MVRIRQTGNIIPDVGFAQPPGAPPGVEVLTLRQLHERTVGTPNIVAPQRPLFHHLLTTSETLCHTIDFTTYRIEAGSWLWVRPGQIQQWGDLAAAQGTLILFEPGFLDTTTLATACVDDPHAPTLIAPGPADRPGIDLAAEHLRHSFERFGRLPIDIHVCILRHLLSVLVLELSRVAADAPPSRPDRVDIYQRFRDAVERDFRSTRRLADYARELGYSPRTLSRATLAAVGVNAKEFIDRRVTLEAQRLLTHSDSSAARIAERLGFPSATNFNKFFRHRTGTTPMAFRNGIRGQG